MPKLITLLFLKENAFLSLISDKRVDIKCAAQAKMKYAVSSVFLRLKRFILLQNPEPGEDMLSQILRKMLNKVTKEYGTFTVPRK